MLVSSQCFNQQITNPTYTMKSCVALTRNDIIVLIKALSLYRDDVTIKLSDLNKAEIGIYTDEYMKAHGRVQQTKIIANILRSHL